MIQIANTNSLITVQTDQITEMANLMQTVGPADEPTGGLTMSVAFDILARKKERESKRVRFDIPPNLDQSVCGLDLEATVVPSNLDQSVYGGLDLEATVDPADLTGAVVVEPGWVCRELAKDAANVDESVNGLDIKNEEGSTALHLAAKEGHAGVVVALLDAGADINARDGAGNTALCLASEAGHVGVVSELIGRLSSGGDVVLPSLGEGLSILTESTLN